MSSTVCRKRLLFQDLHSSLPISKRLRLAQENSPAWFASTPSLSSSSGTRSGPTFDTRLDTRLEAGSLLSQLHVLFPDIEEQMVEKVLEASNNDMDCIIKSLNLLRLSSALQATTDQHASDPFASRPDDFSVQQQQQAEPSGTQSEGSKWVELLVSQMMNASDLETARGRAMHTLEAFENTVISRSAAVVDDMQKENVTLKEQNRGLMHDNQILKRTVVIQHERQQDHKGQALELQQVKQLLSQYHDQVRTLELNNYSLTLHLCQAQERSSMPERFHPNVF